MKYIIDIPEEYYKICKEWKAEKVATIEQAIMADGKPYEERPHGEWVLDKEFSFVFNIYECSKCCFNGSKRWHFCPNCGASMRKEGDAE